jgi:hypothetical protein
MPPPIENAIACSSNASLRHFSMEGRNGDAKPLGELSGIGCRNNITD